MLQLKNKDDYDDRWVTKGGNRLSDAAPQRQDDDVADFFGGASVPKKSDGDGHSLIAHQDSVEAKNKQLPPKPTVGPDGFYLPKDVPAAEAWGLLSADPNVFDPDPNGAWADPNPFASADPSQLATPGSGWTAVPNPDGIVDTLKRVHTHVLDGEGIASDPLESLAPHHHGDHEEHPCPECPGGPFIGMADAGSCFHGGADIHVDFDDEDIEEFFGDNVLMKEWKYYKEGCHKPAQCEFIDPDVNHHQFPVGKSVVRVEGIDIAGNINMCHRTVYILDKQAPKFVVPSKEVDNAIEIDFPENTCSITADKPFLEYEEVNGFIDAATDNCDKDVTIVKKLENADGEIVYDSSKDDAFPELKGPNQTYKLIYEAIDDYSKDKFTADAPEAVKSYRVEKRIHEATLTLNDVQPPYDFQGCPIDFKVEIEAHETHHQGVYWSPPTITGDNCEEFGEIPEAEEQTKPTPMVPGMPLPVGAHPVQYAFKDASGNYIQDRECTFTITVEQKAHPVELSCPGNVSVPTLHHADFGLPIWEEPVAMQGGKILDSSHITYPQGVQPNMPFPFGTTVILVKASGEITGKFNNEDQMFDECTFTVTVTDPQIPKVDGRMYRCKDSNRGDAMGLYGLTTPSAKPYEVCAGLALDWMPHRAYVETHHYDVKYAVERDFRCCRNELRVTHVCKPVPGTNTSSYCVPEED